MTASLLAVILHVVQFRGRVGVDNLDEARRMALGERLHEHHSTASVEALQVREVDLDERHRPVYHVVS